MSTVKPGDRDEPECAYFATPEDLEAARQLTKDHCRLEPDAQTDEPKDK